ncbi:hypothetical protein KR054_010666 [Drosophila jambulina]|nr:hypothetical protein KR054_010666 [Drosophila jambulina]
MDISKVCRVCANQIKDQKSQRNIFKYMRGRLNVQLKLITGVKVVSSFHKPRFVNSCLLSSFFQLTTTEGLPEFLCNRCTSELELAVKFRERCIFSQKYLLEVKKKSPQPHFTNIASPELHEQLIDADQLDGDFVVYDGEDEEEEESQTDEDPEALVMAAAEQAEIEERQQIRALKRRKNFFICSDCGLVFNDECEYNEHIEAHLGRREMKQFFPCPECSQTFKRKSSLKKHQSQWHLGHRQFTCSTCNEVFVALGDKLRHEKAHQNERPYPCLECGMCLPSVSELQAHSLTHPGDKRKFRLDLVLHSHSNSLTLLLLMIRCEPCNKNFQTSNDVKTHSKTPNHKIRAKQMQDEMDLIFDS